MLSLLQGFLIYSCCLVGVISHKKHGAFYRLLFYQVLLAGQVYSLSYAVNDLQKKWTESLVGTHIILMIYLFLLALVAFFIDREKTKYLSVKSSLKWVRLLTVVIFLLSLFMFSQPVWTDDQKINNTWLWNISILSEAILLLWAYTKLLPGRNKRYLYWATLLIFLSLVVENLIKGSYELASYSAALMGVLMCVCFLMYLYQQAVAPNQKWKLGKEFWALLGLTIYFTAYVPYMALFDYLRLNDPEVFVELYGIVLALGSIRYLLMSIGFLFLLKSEPNRTINDGP